MTTDSLAEHAFLWKANPDRYVLVKLPGGAGGLLDHVVYDRVDKGAILIEDDDVCRQVIQKMLDAGVKVHDRIPKD